MLKKLLMAAILGFAIIFAGLQHQVEARDIYVGTSNATGWKCYVMTETIRHPNIRRYYVTLKMITRSGNVKYIDYEFWIEKKRWEDDKEYVTFKNSQGYKGKVNYRGTRIEWEMWQIVKKY